LYSIISQYKVYVFTRRHVFYRSTIEVGAQEPAKRKSVKV
jgi:hypothetical protein